MDDATAMAALVARGEVHPRELVADAIAAIERVDPELNFMVHRQFERALADAEGPLPDGPFRGVPFLFKDYKAREAGERYCGGMALLRDLDFRPTTDSGLALAVRRAGFIPLGRTNTPELALMGTTEPDAFGPTRNPFDLTRSPGGSSGGSAAAVAAGCVPVAHANDIAGSIRIPSAHCGLVGLKPTRGRTTTSMGHDPAVGLFVEGAITRTVRDAAAMLDVLDVLVGAGGDGWWAPPPLAGSLAAAIGRDPGRLRVGLCVAAFNEVTVEAECRAAAEGAGVLLEGLGHAVEPVAPPGYGAADLAAALRGLIAANAAQEVAQWERRLGRPIGEADVEPTSWAMIAAGRAMTAVDVLDLLDVVQARGREVAAWWAMAGIDLLLTPTSGEGPPPLGDYKANYVPGRASAFTRPINATGQPSVSLPLGWPGDGLPRGAQLVAAHGREDLLVQVAAQLEAAAPWIERYP